MHNIASVVVTFNPEDSVIENVRRISDQSIEVFVIDNNSSNSDFLKLLPSNCKLTKSRENIGLASALNLGVLSAIAAGYDWIATFDQDSLIPEKYFEQMLDNIENIETLKIGIISPRYFNSVSGVVKSFSIGKKFKVLENYEIAKTAMTSGSIMSVDAVRHCGIFDDKMFIDQLDNEICLRYRRAGYSIIENQRVIIRHSVGEVGIRNVLNLRFHPSNHNASRRYYIARNRLYVYKKYLVFEFAWVVSDFSAWIRETIKILMFESEKRNKMLNSLSGIYDGFMNRMGPKGD